MLAPVRAMMSGRATPLTRLLGGDLDLVGQVRAQACRARAPVTASGLRSTRRARSTPATLTRSAVPCAITQAEPSFTSVPSGAREICLVSGPPSLVNRVSAISSGGGGRVPPLIRRGGGAEGEGPGFSAEAAGLEAIPSSAMRRRMNASSQCACSQRLSPALSCLCCSRPSGGSSWHCAQM